MHCSNFSIFLLDLNQVRELKNIYNLSSHTQHTKLLLFFPMVFPSNEILINDAHFVFPVFEIIVPLLLISIISCFRT